MRINASEVEHMNYKILLNGKELDNCFEADDKEGYVKCYVTDERGNLKDNAPKGWDRFIRSEEDKKISESLRLETEVLYGKVEIIKLER